MICNSVTLRKLNLKIGQHYKREQEIYKLDEVSDEGAVFSLWHLFGDAAASVCVNVPLDDAQELKRYRLLSSTDKMQKQRSINLRGFLPNAALAAEVAKCVAFQTLSQAFNKLHSADQRHILHFAVCPSELFAGKDYEKGDLLFVPMTDGPGKLSTELDQNPGLPVIKVENASFCIGPPASHFLVEGLVSGQVAEPVFQYAKPVVMPYWHVSKASDGEPGNMVASTVDIGLIKVPCLKNSKVIKKYEKIQKPGDAPPKKKAKVR